MHELSIARNIVAIVAEAAKGRRVSGVTLEIGCFSGVSPDALAFCFPLVAEGTVASRAALTIVEVAGWGRCRDCGGEFEMPEVFTACGCGSRAIMRLRGEELNVRSLDIEAEAETAPV